ncbi:hypothetical protein [Polyangium jinanense]|nr:hypothetical protein [Polyangium jinanense]
MRQANVASSCYNVALCRLKEEPSVMPQVRPMLERAQRFLRTLASTNRLDRERLQLLEQVDDMLS